MAANPEPVFNTFRRKVYRPFYSLLEFRIGLVCLAVLVGVLIWVWHRGAHPDPHLFTADERLLSGKGTGPTIYKRPLEPWVEPGSVVKTAPSFEPFPADIVGDGWTATGPVSEFNETNVYIKIDGREGFYKSYGFKQLDCLSLISGKLSIDIELFDLGDIGNALGALVAEVTQPDAKFDGFFYATANAGYLVQGRYYARLIGSDDNAAIRQKILSLKTALLAKLPAEPVPWAYALLSAGLKISPAKVEYSPQDAFSFDFASDVYSVPVKGDTEVFVSRRANAAEATTMAGKFADAFAGFGKEVPAAGAKLFANTYTGGAIDGVTTRGEYVIGVRQATNVADAWQWLKTLSDLLPAPPSARTIPVGSGHD